MEKACRLATQTFQGVHQITQKPGMVTYDFPCIKEKCEWWLYIGGIWECAIVHIAILLHYISDGKGGFKKGD